MSLLRFLDDGIRRLCLRASDLAGLFIALLVVVGVADVVGTNLAFGPVPGALELSEAMMVAIVFAGMAYAQHRQAHVAIDVFSARFRGRVRVLAAGFTLVAAILVLGMMTWRAGLLAWDSFGIGERSAGLLPFLIYPVKAVMFFGCLVATLEALRRFVRLCAGIPDSADGAVKDGPATP